MKILVTGGVRSGKSLHAEAVLDGEPEVTYVAPGPAPDDRDPEWAARVAAHRARRPGHWLTRETREVAAVIREASTPVLVDCLGTWVTGVLDDQQAWDEADAAIRDLVDRRVRDLVASVRACDATVVLVTNEVGLGVVPAHRSGRLFRDLLGSTNQQVATGCDEVHLLVAGRVLVL